MTAGGRASALAPPGGWNNLVAEGGPGMRKHSQVSVGDGWNRSVDPESWPRLRLELMDDTLVASGYGTDDAVEIGPDAGSESGGGGDGRMVNETVLKCLDSCDKILFRHSTTIT